MGSELWQRLKAVRSFADRRQEDVAKVCGVSRGAVAQWESKEPNNRTRPSVEQVSAIARDTGVPVEWILNDAADTADVWKIGKVYGAAKTTPAAPVGGTAPSRMLDALKKAVEFEVMLRRPDLAEGFAVPIGHGPVAVMADFCCTRCVAQFSLAGDAYLDPDTMGRLLLLERASGKAMTKVLVQCTGSSSSSSSSSVTDYMLSAFGIKVVQVATPAEAAEFLVAACY